MKTSRVMVAQYNAEWKTDFESIKAEIVDALGTLALAVEHVGSTSVEGMSAKPCIDIDVVIEDYSVFAEVVGRLEKIGYYHEGDLGIKGREAFGYTEKTNLQKHHLYVCPRDSEELLRHVTFRDFLRSNPDAVKKYSRIKREAAELYSDDIDGYMAHKAPVIEELYHACGLKMKS